MTSNEIRDQFFDFFRNKEHRIIPSAPVVPYDDPTLLFTNAGMNQFKDVFLGSGKREYTRVADTQKCIRVSGKHNDLEEVGRDTYHHTFFEMLGNWSLGDPANPEKGYYKVEAITWAWELLTEVWKLPKERLWATVYRTDDESLEIWKSKTDINPEHVLKFDEKDNFWEMGEVGPCGPCSEIHINVGDDYDNPKWVNAGVEECIEIWNLVFIQYNRDENGTLHDLPAKHVDTGMGFERIVAVLQNKKSNYETDVFTPIIKKIAAISNVKYEGKENIIAMQVIADHIRTLTFAIADGATPGNEGRGYVLRRILRRAARFGRNINLNEPFLYQLVDVVVDTMGEVFPEIKTNQENVKKIIKGEEASFNVTLDRGLQKFYSIVGNKINFLLRNEGQYETTIKRDSQKIISQIIILKENRTIGILDIKKLNQNIIGKYLKAKPKLEGHEVFYLYDTFGFPYDLINLMAREIGFEVDENRFNVLMEEQKERARGATKNNIVNAELPELLVSYTISNNSKVEFLGYDYNNLTTEATVVKIAEPYIILDKTPFYAESGGQIGDTGNIKDEQGNEVEIVNTIKINEAIAHEYKGDAEKLLGKKINVTVDADHRWEIMRNHSATHLMNAALREVLGEHVQQSGSYVGPDRLRFDFTHYQKLTQEEIQTIENQVNQKIKENIPREQHPDTPFDEAKKMGALMFFGDKYGDKVNVIQFGEFSKEFCGGTHVLNTSDIKYFKIVSESSIASGVRRIEAVTGFGVLKYLDEIENNISELNSKVDETSISIKKLNDKLSESDQKNKNNDENSSNVSFPQNEELASLKESFLSEVPVNVDEVKQFVSVQEILKQKLSVELENLNDEKRKLEKKISELELKSKLGGIDSIVNSPTEVNEIQLFRGKVNASNMDELKSMGDELRNKMKSGVGVLISVFDEKVGIVCVVSDDLIKEKKIMAGKIVGSVAKIVGGGGGGRPHLATAGGRDISKINEALEKTEEIIYNLQ